MMKFVCAKEEDIPAIRKLYKDAIGSEGCTWDEGYPAMEHTLGDLQRGDLFCLKKEDGEVVGAISVDDDKMVEKLPCWQDGGAELARLVVKENYQNAGIAGKMIKCAMEELAKRGLIYVHFLVSKEHKKALKAYDKLEFQNVGESDLYGGDWWCYEKKLSDVL